MTMMEDIQKRGLLAVLSDFVYNDPPEPTKFTRLTPRYPVTQLPPVAKITSDRNS